MNERLANLVKISDLQVFLIRFANWGILEKYNVELKHGFEKLPCIKEKMD